MKYILKRAIYYFFAGFFLLITLPIKLISYLWNGKIESKYNIVEAVELLVESIFGRYFHK